MSGNTSSQYKALGQRAQRFGEAYALEFFVQFCIAILGIFLGYSSLANSSKFALGVLFIVFDVVFLFFRVIVRRIDELANDYLTVIPRNKLSNVLYQHLDSQRGSLLDRAEQLAEHHSCELEKHEMYGELIGLTHIVTRHYGASRAGTIWAISSINIEDFDEEPLAEAYLGANRAAVGVGVDVRRLFLLDQGQVDSRRVKRIVEAHDEVLHDGHAVGESGVRWILRSNLSGFDQAQDFALFATEALVTQSAAGGLAELTHETRKLKRADEVFLRLWQDSHTHPVSELGSVGRR